MRIFRVFLVVGGLAAAAGFAACNNTSEPAAPSTKAVDSAMAAAPDTIKPIPMDSGRGQGSAGGADSTKR